MSNITESSRSRWTEIKQETREGANTATRVGDAGLQLVAAVENTENNFKKLKIHRNESITCETHSNYLPPKPFPGHIVLLKSDHYGYYGIGCYQATFKRNADGISYRIIHDSNAMLELKQTPVMFNKHSIDVTEWKFTSGLIPIHSQKISIKPVNTGSFEFDISYYDANQMQISSEAHCFSRDNWNTDKKRYSIDYATAPAGAKYIRINNISSSSLKYNSISHVQIYEIYHFNEGKLPDITRGDQSIPYWFDGTTWQRINLDNDCEVRVRKGRIIYRYVNNNYFYTGRINPFNTPELMVAHRAFDNSKILLNENALNLYPFKLGIFFRKRLILANGYSKKNDFLINRKLKYYHYVPYDLTLNDTARSVGLRLITKLDEFYISVLSGSVVQKHIPGSKKDEWRHYYGFIAYYEDNKKNSRHEIFGEKIPFLFKVKNMTGGSEGCIFAFERISEGWNPIKI
jgi:hypothetical protein